MTRCLSVFKVIVPIFFTLLVLHVYAETEGEFLTRLAIAALERTKHQVIYDPAYLRIPYPGGDVPRNRGVCTDVVIRSYRQLGVDLQKLVHEDMKANFSLYPRKYGARKPDTSIDHRRVPNLEVFFSRKGQRLRASTRPEDYSPGDIVVWDLETGQHHIGLVSDRKTSDGKRFQIVHNVGAGDTLEDVLFRWPVIGHYRYVVANP